MGTSSGDSRRAPGLTERVGEAVWFPARAARRVLGGGPGGLYDVVGLLVLRVLATQTIPLAQGVARLRDEGLSALAGALRQAARSVGSDVLLVLCGATALSLALGERERLLRQGMCLDLAAQALMPWLFLHVLAALLWTLLGVEDPPQSWHRAVQLAALLCFAGSWLFALRETRRFLAR